MSDSEADSLPSDLEEMSRNIVDSLLPEKSRSVYEMVFNRYEEWCSAKKIKNITYEKVLLAYFECLSKERKPSSLWSYYSMIRSILSTRKNVDISKYLQLVALLKRKSEGYRAKKSKIFTKQDVTKFLTEASDDTYLFNKVAMIIGLSGACRREELTNMLVENVIDEGSVFRITLPNTKTKVMREFFVTSGNIPGLNMVELVRQYVKIRPCNTNHLRFFVTYRNKKCTKQPVGIHTFGKMPKVIATFLNLPRPEEYTGHCFRRSSASFLADSGADLCTVKRHGGWKSNTVAEGYIENSKEQKKKISEAIFGANNQTGLQVCQQSSTTDVKTVESIGINITNCSNCSFTIYNK